jgi:hypothetical protein
MHTFYGPFSKQFLTEHCIQINQFEHHLYKLLMFYKLFVIGVDYKPVYILLFINCGPKRGCFTLLQLCFNLNALKKCELPYYNPKIPFFIYYIYCIFCVHHLSSSLAKKVILYFTMYYIYIYRMKIENTTFTPHCWDWKLRVKRLIYILYVHYSRNSK